jgi:hypothetical protein
MTLLLIYSLILSMAGALPFPAARAQGSAHRRSLPDNALSGKMSNVLSMRAKASRRQDGRSGGERARVILNLADESAASSARAMLQGAGASVRQELDELGVMVADVPVERLEELSARDEVAWMSEDAEVRSLAVKFCRRM